MSYVLDCDENCVPALRPQFRQSPTVMYTNRDQLGNPIPHDAATRCEPRLGALAAVLADDAHTQRINPKGKAEARKRGGLDKGTPKRNGKVVEAPKVAKRGKKLNGQAGKGAFHRQNRSSKFPPSKLR